MATSSTEARRRRIMDRGSDRLALITGRFQALPLSSAASSPPLISHDHQHLQTHLSDQSLVSTHGKDKPSSCLLPKHDSGTEYGQFNASDGGNRLLQTCEITELSGALASKVDDRVQSSLVSSAVQSSPISASDTEHHSQPHPHQHKFFTPNQIRSAITASESIRIYCSLAAAILVVLSYVGFPVLGSNIIKGIIIWRPLYLLLLTNISIVLAQLLLENQRGFERAEQKVNGVPSTGEYGLAEQVGKALESGLVLQNIMGALFMDCSVYAIVVICAISLVQRLGS